MKRALISVSDKTGVAEFARRLQACGFEIVSTGGTAAVLRAGGLDVREVTDLTGFPEILDGRVKTLHPAIHAGILARREDAAHMETLAAHGIGGIDLVAVNLYPFGQIAWRPGCSGAEAVESIDVGGVALLRAAAKNHESVTAICDPSDYNAAAGQIETSGGTALELRRALAAKVFRHTSAYDAAIALYLAGGGASAPQPEALPPVWVQALPLGSSLRYGENPHQRAALYRDLETGETCVARAAFHQGKELSYNNLLDGDAALEAVRDFADLAPAACVIVKHGNPCGIALGSTPARAYTRAHECDPDSAFGGIVAFSATVDAETAERVTGTFNEAVIAPEVAPEALDVFAKKKNLRVLSTGPFLPKRPALLSRGIVGGTLVTDRDIRTLRSDELQLVTSGTPTEADLAGLLFAWRCVKWIKSNAIVYTSREATLGIGAGQMSRVDSARFAIQKARKPLAGSYMASDAFLPFRDSVDAAAAAGVRGIVQPGGSVRDREVIDAANEHGILMVFTGVRHFRH